MEEWRSCLQAICTSSSLFAHLHTHTHTHTMVWMVHLELVQNNLVIDIVSYLTEDFWQSIIDEVEKVPQDAVSVTECHWVSLSVTECHWVSLSVLCSSLLQTLDDSVLNVHALYLIWNGTILWCIKLVQLWNLWVARCTCASRWVTSLAKGLRTKVTCQVNQMFRKFVVNFCLPLGQWTSLISKFGLILFLHVFCHVMTHDCPLEIALFWTD